MASYSRQNKQRGSALVIVLAAAAVLVTGGAIAYVLLSKNKGNGGGIDLGNITHKTITADTPDGVKALLTNAKAGDYDAKCTYTDESGDGTIYVSGATKMRVDTTINDKAGHVLRLGDAGYIWADGDSEGSKLPVSDAKNNSRYSPETFANKVEEHHVKCQSVSHLDDSLFAIPSGVNFVDVNNQLRSSHSSN